VQPFSQQTPSWQAPVLQLSLDRQGCPVSAVAGGITTLASDATSVAPPSDGSGARSTERSEALPSVPDWPASVALSPAPSSLEAPVSVPKTSVPASVPFVPKSRHPPAPSTIHTPARTQRKPFERSDGFTFQLSARSMVGCDSSSRSGTGSGRGPEPAAFGPSSTKPDSCRS